jgi:hypothetical protein
METTPRRGCTVFQRRVDGSGDFYRNRTDYKTGFGNLSCEFWLGLDKIHRLSASGQNVLRVDLESFEKETAYAVCESFSVGNESEVYILNVGGYSGRNKSIYKVLECMCTEIIPKIVTFASEKNARDKFFYFFYNISRRYYIVNNFTLNIDLEILLTCTQ